MWVWGEGQEEKGMKERLRGYKVCVNIGLYMYIDSKPCLFCNESKSWKKK